MLGSVINDYPLVIMDHRSLTIVPRVGMPLGRLRGSYWVPSIPVVDPGLGAPRVPWWNRLF